MTTVALSSLQLGTWLGAWPTIPSIGQFQTDSGRHMDTVNLYVGWETPFSSVQPNLDPVYQNCSTAMITWQPNVDTTQITSSNQTVTQYITQFANDVKTYGKPILIRPMHEMNISQTQYVWALGDSTVNTNTTYQAAWQYIVSIFRQVGTTNASFVWCINNSNVGNGSSYTGAYPTDTYVDYVAIDGYNWGTSQSGFSWQTFSQVFTSAYQALTGLTQKPILLTEWASTEVGGNKAAWITDAFQQITTGNFPQIAGLIWFNENKETDWRIESSAAAQQAYYQAVHTLKIGAWLGSWPNSSLIQAFQTDSCRHMDTVELFVGWGSTFSDIQPSLNAVYQNCSTATVTWQPNVDTTQITSSNQTVTNYITQFANAVKAYQHTIFIRPMHEMNGNWYPHWSIGGSSVNTNQTYIAAWQYIVGIFRQVGATNALFVWCINNSNVGHGSSYTGAYPGDSYVDYVGIDGYNWGTSQSWGSTWQTFSQVFTPAYQAVTDPNGQIHKPIFISEWASTELGGNKAAWITDAFQQITSNNFPQVTLLNWFNQNKETDWRIESSAAAQQAYCQAVHNL